MKTFILSFFTLLTIDIFLGSCKPAKPAEVNYPAEMDTAAEINALPEEVIPKDSTIVPEEFISKLDKVISTPDTIQSKKKYEHPPTNPVTTGDCNVGFKLISNPTRNSHIIYVSGLEAGNQKCWYTLLDYSIKYCEEKKPCEITYVDVAQVTKTATAPYYVDIAQLKKNGIAYFDYKNKWWEIRGAKLWGRPGREYDYYSSTRFQ